MRHPILRVILAGAAVCSLAASSPLSSPGVNSPFSIKGKLAQSVPIDSAGWLVEHGYRFPPYGTSIKHWTGQTSPS